MADRQSPLKVLQVASSLYDWGGIERYVVYLSQALESRGHQVTIACPSGSPIYQRFPRSIAIEMRKKLDFRGFSGYLRLFQAHRYDVIHGHFSPDFTLPAYAAKLTRQPLTVMTRHVAMRWPRAKAEAYGRLWNHIIPVSQAVERRLIESGISPKQMTVAKAGLPEPRLQSSRSETRKRFGLRPDAFAVGSFGRLAAEKGIDVFVSALAQMPNVQGCIFGHGPSDSKLRESASANTTFFGQLPDVFDAMHAMDAVVIPSVWEEPFPYSALEAMALARPIVASDIGGLPELVEDGKNGLLFPAGNFSELVSCLGKLQNSVDLRSSLGDRGRKRYEREFTVDQMASRIESVYESLR